MLMTHALKVLSLILVHSAEVGVASDCEGVCAKRIINVKEALDQDYITADSEVCNTLTHIQRFYF